MSKLPINEQKTDIISVGGRSDHNTVEIYYTYRYPVKKEISKFNILFTAKERL